MNECEKLFREFKGDLSKRNKLRLNFQKSRNIFDRELRSKERLFYKNKLQSLEYLSKGNQKEFWDRINNLGPGKKRNNVIPNTVIYNNSLSCELNIVRNKWFLDFKNLYAGPKQHIRGLHFEKNILTILQIREQQMKDEKYEENIYLNSSISFDELENVVKNLKKKKAVGIDSIPYEMLKSHSVLLFIYRLFTYCFYNGVVPSAWRCAIISPILKKGKDPLMPLSYRGISLLSCLGKVYTALISHRIVKYCEMLDLMCDEQNGFRSKRSCAHHIYVVTSIIRNRLSQGLETFAAMIDMEKAFDCLKRPFLYFKLLELNIDGKIYNAIKTLYSDNKAFVRVNNDVQTDWFDVPYGVRQGDPLSSTLFNIYINGLAEHLKQLDLGIEISNGLKICILLYADDIILILRLTCKAYCSHWNRGAVSGS